MKESVSRWGITWTFDKPARAGQFVNGDFYVGGPVAVVKIDPAPRYGKDVYLDDSKDWFHEGYADQPWIKQLWDKYRPLSPAATDGWKQKHDDSYYRNAIAKQLKK